MSSIRVAPGLISHVAAVAREVAPAHRYAIITDANVGPIYAARVRDDFKPNEVEVLTIAPGEPNKTRDAWASLTDQLLARGFGRDSGGGSAA